MVRAGIVGVTGYAGAELLRLLIGHPGVEIAHLVSESNAGAELDSLYGNFKGLGLPTMEALDPVALGRDCDVVFTALPHVVSAEVVPQIAAAGARVIDLSGDFRYRDAGVYAQWYGHEHPHPELLQGSVYGMPELYRGKIRTAQIVGNPGCYTTCSILSLAPAVKDGLIDMGFVIIDAKSGVSGGIVTVAPGKGGLGTFSPRLDPAGNSVRGQRAARFLSHSLGLDIFASTPGVF